MTSYVQQSVFDAIKQAPGFASLADSVIERLALHSRHLRLHSGEALSRRGQPQTLLSLILSGCLEVSIHGREGKRHVVRHLLPGEVFGLIPVLDGGVAVHDSDAQELTLLVQIPGEILIAELNTQPTLSMRILQLFCGRFRQLYEVLAFQQLLTLYGRTAHLLVSLASVEPQLATGRTGEIAIHMTQTEMSDMLGVSRQSLNAELKKIERQGLVRLAHAKIVVTDVGALKKIANESV